MLAYFMTHISCHIDHDKLLSEVLFQILSGNSIPEFIFLRAMFALTDTDLFLFFFLFNLVVCLFVCVAKENTNYFKHLSHLTGYRQARHCNAIVLRNFFFNSCHIYRLEAKFSIINVSTLIFIF